MLTKSLIEDVRCDLFRAEHYSCTKDDVYVKEATLSVCMTIFLIPFTIVIDILTGVFQLIYILIQNCIWRRINK